MHSYGLRIQCLTVTVTVSKMDVELERVQSSAMVVNPLKDEFPMCIVWCPIPMLTYDVRLCSHTMILIHYNVFGSVGLLRLLVTWEWFLVMVSSTTLLVRTRST